MNNPEQLADQELLDLYYAIENGNYTPEQIANIQQKLNQDTTRKEKNLTKATSAALLKNPSHKQAQPPHM